MKPHPQAELLRAIADGEEMEQAYHQEPKWRAVDSTTVLDWITNGSLEYYTPYFRIKPKTININGIEVPEPMREMPPEGTSVYWPGFGPDSGDTHTESADVGYYPTYCPTCCVRDCCTSPKKLPPSTLTPCFHSQGESNVHRWTQYVWLSAGSYAL